MWFTPVAFKSSAPHLNDVLRAAAVQQHVHDTPTAPPGLGGLLTHDWEANNGKQVGALTHVKQELTAWRQ